MCIEDFDNTMIRDNVLYLLSVCAVSLRLISLTEQVHRVFKHIFVSFYGDLHVQLMGNLMLQKFAFFVIFNFYLQFY
jgi:hypothetical protein